MKKSLLLFSSVLLLFSFFGPVKAQQGMKPFEHLGVGLEVGTLGAGLDFAVPVHSHLVVRAGFNILPFSYSDDYYINHDRQRLNDLINDTPEFKQILIDQGLGQYTNTDNLPHDIDLDGKLRMVNGKVVVDYYPFKTSSFHVIAGLYFGKNKIITLDGQVDPNTNKLLGLANSYFPDEEFDSSVTVEDYRIVADDNGNINANLKINSVKPYLGIGFGNSIPKKTGWFPL
ncbi:MAG: hypothetical protein LUG51_01390 [Tannerellaceae bacterium]|nr:hypothetical protein [Tannerellaceae bacterium]